MEHDTKHLNSTRGKKHAAPMRPQGGLEEDNNAPQKYRIKDVRNAMASLMPPHASLRLHDILAAEHLHTIDQMKGNYWPD